MIRSILIENFKSLQRLELTLGRINLLIGANGCGKTNILEALCFGAAAAAHKLDREFLVSRGIRVASPRLMRSGFVRESERQPIHLRLCTDAGVSSDLFMQHSNRDFAKWKVSEHDERVAEEVERSAEQLDRDRSRLEAGSAGAGQRLTAELANFLVYSPQLPALRALERESFIEPLGIYGEGLFRLLKNLEENGKLPEIKAEMEAIDWFEDFELLDSVVPGERVLRIRDRYLNEGVEFFDHNSSNEGFLYLLFYVCLILSEDTPRFFAIDNIESALNPKLCIKLIESLVRLAAKHGKQLLLTTHNPAVLDGLNLADEEQRLFVIHRDLDGGTRAQRVTGERWLKGERAIRLSEAFLRGYLGGLPTNF